MEVMDIEGDADDVLLDDVIPQVIGLDLLLEVLLVPREEVAFPPAGAVELHDDRAVDLARLAGYPGQGQSRRLEPVALRVPVRLPAQDALRSEEHTSELQ